MYSVMREEPTGSSTLTMRLAEGHCLAARARYLSLNWRELQQQSQKHLWQHHCRQPRPWHLRDLTFPAHEGLSPELGSLEIDLALAPAAASVLLLAVTQAQSLAGRQPSETAVGHWHASQGAEQALPVQHQSQP